MEEHSKILLPPHRHAREVSCRRWEAAWLFLALFFLFTPAICWGQAPGRLIRPGDFPASLRGWWKLEEASGNRLDSSGSNNHLTPIRGAQHLPENYWSATGGSTQLLDDTEQELQIAHAAQTGLEINGANAVLTMAAWVRIDRHVSANRSVIYKHDAIAHTGYGMAVTSSGNLMLNINDNTFYEAGDGSVAVKRWHHVAVSFDSLANRAVYFVDGRVVGVRDDVTADILPCVDFFRLGSDDQNSHIIEGQMHDAAVWARVLAPQEIKSLASGIDVSSGYRPGNVSVPPTAWWKLNEISSGAANVTRVDSSGAHPLTENAANRVGTAGGYLDGSAADFEASNTSCMTAADSPDWNMGTGDFAIAFWVRPESVMQGHEILTRDGPSFRISLDNSNRLNWQGGGGDVWTSLPDIPPFRTGAWSHVVCMRQAGNAHVYRDGVELGSPKLSTTNVQLTGMLHVGSDGSGLRYLDGQLADLAIWKGYALSLAEIKALATALPVQKAGIVSYWPLDEVGGTRNDAVGPNHLTPVNVPGSAAGVIGNAVDFESGSSQCLKITNAAQNGLNITGSLSILGWVRHESLEDNQAIASRGIGSEGYTLSYQNSRSARFSAGGASQSTDFATSAITAGTWFFLGGVWDEAQGHVIFNGAVESFGGGGMLVANEDDFTLGAADPVLPPDFMDGLLDEVIIARRWFRPEEVKALYNRGLNSLAAVPLPEIAVEQPVGTGLTAGTNTVGMGAAPLGGAGVPQTFTIRNLGNADLPITSITFVGAHSADFVLNTSGTSTTVPPGGSTTCTVALQPLLAGERAAVLRIVSLDEDESTFDVALTGTGLWVASPAAFITGSTIGITANGYTATGGHVNLVLGHAPAAGATLTVVNNTSTDPINGAFANLEHGQIVVLNFNGTGYRFMANYQGGTGNDLVLHRADPGVLDLSFATTGRMITPIGPGSDHGRAVAVQSDGKIVLAGHSHNGTNNDFALVRCLPDGTLDTSFDGDGKVTTAIGTGNDQARAVAVQSDGKIVVAGYASNGSNDDFVVARYLANGALDTLGFGTGGMVVTPIGTGHAQAFALALQPDGKILVAGSAVMSGNTDFAMVRYLANGAPDTSFGTDGKVATAVGTSTDVATSLALAPDGRIVLAGNVTVTGTSIDFGVVRYNADGSVDTTFNGSGKVITSWSTGSDDCNAVTVQPDGRIIAVGQKKVLPNDENVALVRYTATGQLDTSFGAGTGKVATVIGGHESALGVALQADGRIVVAGNRWNIDSSDPFLIRYLADGTRDVTFGSNGALTVVTRDIGDNVFGVALQNDGKIVLGGYNSEEFTITRLLADPVAPEIHLTGDGVAVAGGSAPSATNHTDFGSAAVASGIRTRTFTIQNLGTGDLRLYAPSVTLSGAHAADFSITSYPPMNVVAGGAATFTVAFDPGTVGLCTATLTLVSDDSDEAAYGFSIQGTGSSGSETGPEMAITGNTVAIASGDIAPSMVDHTDFSAVDITGGTATRTFTVQNSGTTELALGTVTVSGTHAGDFTVSAQPGTTVAAGSSTTFQMVFDPAVLGTRSATLSLANGDADENPFLFAIQGTGIAPEILVESPASVALTSGMAQMSYNTGLVGTTSQPKSFSIRNVGSNTLSSLSVTVVGAHAADFTPNVSGMAAALAPAGSTSFGVTFTPGGAGPRAATLRIASNDTDENPFEIALSGTGASLEEAAQRAYVKASNGEGIDYFGQYVAISGDTMVVTSTGEDSSTTGVNTTANNNADGSGAAYVFVRGANGLWTQQAYLKASNTATDDYFGRSAAIWGDTLVVGADGEDSAVGGVNGNQGNNAALQSGAAYVFVRSGTTWSQQAYLKAATPTAGFGFGKSVAVGAETVLVGCAGGTKAYVFVRNGTAWSQQAELTGADTESGDGFGVAVALSGDTAAVSAHKEDGSVGGVTDTSNNSLSDCGAAYVFVRSGSTWAQQARLKASTPGSDDYFGWSMALSGDTLVVGAHEEDGGATTVNGSENNNATNAGAAYVFVRSGGTWTQQAYLKASNSATNDEFGTSVAVWGDSILVGAPREDSSATWVNGNEDDDSATDAGAVYFFKRTAGVWTQEAYLKASNMEAGDAFGDDLALSGDTGVIGAWGEDGASWGVNGDQTSNGSGNSGAVHVFGGLGVAQPEIVVEQTEAGALWDGSGPVAFASVVDVGSSSVAKPFTIRNTGPGEMTGLAVSFGGQNGGDFQASALSSTTLAPGASTTFTVTFQPTAPGNREAWLRIASNDGDENPFDVRLTAVAQGTLTATLASGTDVALVSNGFNASGSSVVLTLGHAPAPYAILTVVNNIGASAISGRFGNLPQGQTIALMHGATAYSFMADYFGGDGNDLVLRRRDPGLLDLSFHGVGWTTTTFGAGNEQANDVVVQPDGKTVAVGTAHDGSTDVFALVRYTIGGELDPTFGVGGKVMTSLGNQGSEAHAVALLPDGRIVVAGFAIGDGIRRIAVARYLANGMLDDTFDGIADGNGKVTTLVGELNAEGRDLVLLPDGKILVGGDYWSGADTDFVLVRYNANGTLDTSFDSDGIVTTANPGSHDEATCLALAPDGRMVLGGYEQTGSTYLLKVARYTVAGMLDDSFSWDGLLTTNIASAGSGRDITVQPDGKILLVGHASGGGGQDVVAVRYLVGGSLDSSFGDNGVATFAYGGFGDYGKSVLLQPDGKILISGITEDGTAEDMLLLRLNTDGSLDTSFALTGKVAASFGLSSADHAHGMALALDGRIVLAGVAAVGGNHDFAVARFLGNPAWEVDGRFAPVLDGDVAAIVRQADGKVVVGGGFMSVNGAARPYVARLNPDGSTDQGFNPDVDYTVSCIAMLPDGKLLIGGAFSMVGGQTRSHLARLNVDGSVDLAFNASLDYVVNGILPQKDGKVVIVGGFTNAGGMVRNRVARLNANGTVDGGFSPSADGDVLAIAQQPDGRFVIGGLFSTVNGVPRSNLARLNADGTLDAGFTPGTDMDVMTLAVQADGKVVLGGAFTMVGADAAGYFARLNSNGTLDASFNPQVSGPVTSVALRTDGRMVIGGVFDRAGGAQRYGVARLKSDGSVDDGSAPVIDQPAGAVMIDNDGGVLLGGTFATVDALPRTHVVRVEADPAVQVLSVPDLNRVQWLRSGSAAETWEAVFELSVDGGTNWSLLGQGTRISGGWELAGLVLPNSGRVRATARNTGGFLNGSAGLSQTVASFTFLNVNAEVHAAAMQPDGKTLIAGSFTNVGVDARNRVARFHPNGTIDTSFAPDVNNTVSTVAVQADGKVVVGGSFSAIGSTTRNNLARLQADGALDTTFNPNANGAINSIAIQPSDGRIVVGGSFTSIGGGTRNRLARLSTSGVAETGFNHNVNGVVNSVLVQGDGKILFGGAFTNFGAIDRNGLARLNAIGSIENNFTPNVSGGSVSAIALQADGKILIGGTFTTVNGVARSRIARLEAGGALDLSFNPGADGEVRAIVVQANGRIVVSGVFTTLAGAARQRLACLNIDGTIDDGFVNDANNTVSSLLLKTDGDLLAGGVFTSLGGAAMNYLALVDLEASTQSLTIPDPTQVQWLRGATSPESQHVTFELSTNGGTNWTSLNPASRVPGGWAASGLSLPGSGQVRARARTQGGRGGGSAGLVEVITTFSGFVPEIAVEQPAANPLAHGGSVNAGLHTLGSSRALTFTIRNDGLIDLSGISVQVTGTHAADFVVSSPPPALLAPGVAGALTVTFAPTASGTRTATLRISSNDSDEPTFDLTLTGMGVKVGGVDPFFNPNVGGETWDEVSAIAVQGDGRILIGGNIDSVGGVARPSFARLNADGSLDQSFLASVNGDISSIVVQMDGQILISGTFTTVNGVTRNRIARLNPDGSLESTTTFNPGTAFSGGFPTSLVVQPDRKIVAVGTFTAFGGQARNRVARLNPDGTLEAVATFNIGTGPNGDINTVALQPDGRMLIGGGFSQVNGTSRVSIARLNSDGTLDTSFTPGTGAPGGVKVVLVQPDGKILMGGHFASYNGTPCGYVARLQSNGTLDPWGAGSGAGSYVYGMALQADGRLVVVGAFGQFSGQSRGCVARLNPDGTPESSSSFDPGTGTNGPHVTAVTIQADGGILLGGVFTAVNGQTRNKLARLVNAPPVQSLTVPDTTRVLWTRGGSAPEIQQAKIDLSVDGGTSWAPKGDGVRVAGGWEFTGLTLAVSGQLRARGMSLGGYYSGSAGQVAYVDSFSIIPPEIAVDGPADTPVADGGAYSFQGVRVGEAATAAFTVKSVGSGILAGVSLSIDGPAAPDYTITSSPLSHVGGPGSSTTFTVRFLPGAGGLREAVLHIANNDPDESPYDIALSGTGVLPGVLSPYLNTAADGDIYTVAVQPDGKLLLGGSFTVVGGLPRNGLARLNSDGSLDTAFNPNVTGGWVESMAVQNDGKIVVGGTFTGIAGTARDRIARLSDDGTLDSSFDPDANGGVTAICVGPDGRMLVGGVFTTVGGQPHSRIVRLNSDGTADDTFSPGSGPNGGVTSIAIDAAGGILVSGVFTTFNGVARNSLARLSAGGILDAAFQPNANGTVRLAVPLHGGKYMVGGDFTSVGGGSINRIARLNSDGTIDTSFNPGTGASGEVRSIVVQADGKMLAGGTFTSFNGTSRGRVVRLLANGGVDTAFSDQTGTGAGAVVDGIALRGDGQVLLCGRFSTFNGFSRPRLAMLANDAVTQSLAVPGITTVRWSRAGSLPAASHVKFALSQNGGVSWAPLGEAVRVGDLWELTGLDLPSGGLIRGRAFVPGGQFTASGGIVEVQAGYSTPPQPTTLVASAHTINGATLNASVVPNGTATVYFEYGPTDAYGASVAVSPVSGGEAQAVSAVVSGLAPNATYHYRVVAANSAGTVFGNKLTFATLPDPPVAVTAPAINTTTSSATLVAAVNPGGRPTSVRFEYGLTTHYGNFTGLQEIGEGATTVEVTAAIINLSANATYYYRVVATNAAGTRLGDPVSFQASAGGNPTAVPSVTTGDAINIGTTAVTLQGLVIAHGGPTNAHFEYGIVPGYGATGSSLGAGSGTTPVAISERIANLLPGTQYQFRLVAENGLGTREGMPVTFTTSFLPPSASTGTSVPVAGSTTSVHVNGSVRAHNASTQVFFDYGTDGVNFPTSIAAAPATVTGDVDTPVGADLTSLLQFTTYHYRVRAVSSGGTTTGEIRTFQPQVISGLAQTFPPAPPAATGSVTMTLKNGGATAGWRFVGEQRWRASGETVSGMTTGDREIEYRPLPGLIQPPREVVGIVAGSPTLVLERDYYVTPASGSGGLRVSLKPDSIITGSGRAQWRLLGAGEDQWRDSGAELGPLAAGSYLVECSPVTGRATPPVASVRVDAGQVAVSTITYFLADTQAGTPPAVLPFSGVSTDTTKPYAYVGQILSNAGMSSGFVVKTRVVGTAGHVVWDDGSLSAAQGLQWLFQRDAATYEPKPIIPRGFYIFDGYTALRQSENTPGTSSPQSQHLDVAALYFHEDAGRGGHGGFLASDLAGNEFLLSSAAKTLVGYPVNGVAVGDQGRMHATAVGNITFTAAFGRTFITTGIRSVGGNSGGPLCVQHSNGVFYPAAIYLGGTGQTVVRAIDSAVIDLFNRAEVSGGGGGNNTGGGITHTSITTVPAEQVGILKVNIAPAGAVSAGAGWRLKPEQNYRPTATEKSLAKGTYVLQFTPVPGFQEAADQSIEVSAGQQQEITFTYESNLTPQESWRQTHFGSSANSGNGADTFDADGDGHNNLAEYIAGTHPTNASDHFKAQNPTRGAGTFSLSTAGKTGRTYELQRSTTLNSAGWTIVTSQGPLGADATVTLTDSSSPAGQAFYRIRVTVP